MDVLTKRQIKDSYANWGKYYREYKRKQLKNNPEKVREQAKKYYYNNHTNRRILLNKHNKITRNRLRSSVLGILNNKCNKCELSDVRTLQIDHIFGKGGKERQEFNPRKYLKKVLNSIRENKNEYQLLCANCNWIKRRENKEEKNVKCKDEVKKEYDCKREIRIKNCVYNLLGNKCNRCNNEDRRCLQIDHVNGGGSITRYSLLKKFKIIEKGSKDFQILCANCNWIKRFENDEINQTYKK